MSIRVTQAAEILGVTAQTVRNWCNDGRLDYSFSVAGQRVFNKEYLINLVNEKNGAQIEPEKIFYTRSSNGKDTLIKTQIDKLTASYGKPDNIYQDKASGLNENRKGLNQLITHIINSQKPIQLYITNKDRLTRFGYSYLEKMFNTHNCEIILLDNDETKEPHEILMQDFMSLLASFSGKFYRLRGWEQQKNFLKDVQNEVNNHGKK